MNDNPGFKQSGNNSGFGYQPIGPSPLGGGDIHDTFKVNENGDVSGGHTTVQNLGGQKINVGWDANLKK